MTDSQNNPLAFKQAIIKEKIQENSEVFSLTLAPADGAAFNFVPGRFNMLNLPGYGEAPFSFSSPAINTQNFTHTIRLAGNVVESLSKLTTNDKIYYRGPYGSGWPIDKAEGKNVIIVAGGIGMAPLRPTIYHILQNRKKFKDVFLLYGARTTADLLYPQELKNWTKDIHVLLSADKLVEPVSDIREGLVITLFKEINVDLAKTVTFMCGPQVMMRFVALELILNGHDPNSIFVSLERRMKCGIGHCGHCQIGAKFVCKDGPVFSYLDIKRFADNLL